MAVSCKMRAKDGICERNMFSNSCDAASIDDDAGWEIHFLELGKWLCWIWNAMDQCWFLWFYNIWLNVTFVISDKQTYRLSNNGLTTWRPTVETIRVYSDIECTRQVSATYVAQSGCNPKDSRQQDGSKAFDDSTATHWRPQCPQCVTGEAWVTFYTASDIKCAKAYQLGKGEGGGNSWNVGIQVERLDHGIWNPIFESNSGNFANGTYLVMVY